ncbi:alkylated DNA nucleotide flippase Atl1 [Arthrobacter pigmenti]|uniref:Alkylated DNA nucleotide flippase Atl1 n=1 Tax=Arthrobacter pigmenti TaxID=271432 RepID=A0A846RMY8_9MICC|nr:MGMT family protein [Arthrobacter pigmenti]NJC22980.1 alkylated DNA nucleotide flippase Atl1 [Arthrobacter pigmenti]
MAGLMRERSDDYAEAVLDIVRLIPPGKVLTYGDIAEILEQGGPRQVGAVMALGSEVPWWRVIRAGGKPPHGLEAAAVEHYRQESTPLRHPRAGGAATHGLGYLVDMKTARWNPEPVDQEQLQGIRKRLARRLRGSGEELSEPDDAMNL